MSLCPVCPSGCDCSVTVTVAVTDPVSKVVTSTSSVSSAAGTVAAGASSLSFFNYGPAVITVNGQPLAVHAAISFPFLGQGVTYPAITYDATGSTVRIDTTIIP